MCVDGHTAHITVFMTLTPLKMIQTTFLQSFVCWLELFLNGEHKWKNEVVETLLTVQVQMYLREQNHLYYFFLI